MTTCIVLQRSDHWGLFSLLIMYKLVEQLVLTLDKNTQKSFYHFPCSYQDLILIGLKLSFAVLCYFRTCYCHPLLESDGKFLDLYSKVLNIEQEIWHITKNIC